MNTRKRISVVALLCIAACGSGTSGVSAPAGALLHTRVAAIRTAASHGDRSAAADQLTQLRDSVAALRARGEISDAAAKRILGAAATVQTELALLPPPSTTTTTTIEPTTTTKPKPPGPPKKGPGPKDHHHGPDDQNQ